MAGVIIENNISMNAKYTLKNFRVFDEQGATFELAPVTILTGCNSSGKSSITKSLMLLNPLMSKYKQSIMNNNFGANVGSPRSIWILRGESIIWEILRR